MRGLTLRECDLGSSDGDGPATKFGSIVDGLRQVCDLSSYREFQIAHLDFRDNGHLAPEHVALLVELLKLVGMAQVDAFRSSLLYEIRPAAGAASAEHGVILLN